MAASGRHRRRDADRHGPVVVGRPPSPGRPGGSAPRRGSLAVVAGLGLAAVTLVGGSAAIGVPTPAAGPTAASTGVPTAVTATPLAPPDLTLAVRPAAAPVRAAVLDIPALGVHSELVDLDVDTAGVLQPPSSPDVAGWFTGAAVPGEVGPTVIAGHIDSPSGPGVFFRLAELTPGVEIAVGRSDGRSVRYRVVDVLTVAKNEFPTARVYGPTPGPELRLITCGGEFDRHAGRYLRNVVVSAVLVDPA